MGLFGKKPKDVVVRWSPESDSTWAGQKRNALFKPMKHIRYGGLSVMIQSFDSTPDGMLVTNVSVSNFDEKAAGFNSGGFALICGDRAYRCGKLRVRLGRRDRLRGDNSEGREVGFRDALVSQFQEATFTAYFNSPALDEAFDLVVEAKRIFASHIVFVTPYEKSELADWGLGR